MKKLLLGLLIVLTVSVNGQFVNDTKTGKIDVALQDQTTDPIIFKFNKITNSTTLSVEAVINTFDLTLTSATGALIGSYVIVFNPDTKRLYKGNVLAVNSNVLTMDTPLDSTFPIGSFVDITVTNMGVDGSTTTQTFGLRGVSPSPVGITVDVTRLIIHVQTEGIVSLSKFGDIVDGITNGVVLRVRNGRNFNIFNVKTNGEIAALLFDWEPFLTTNPVQGQNGFLARFTLAGQNKIGVVIRLMPGEDLELLIQDNLSTITLFEVTAEGHIVDP